MQSIGYFAKVAIVRRRARCAVLAAGLLPALLIHAAASRADSQVAAGPGPHEIGSWSALIPWPQIAIYAASLPDGRILTWSSTETNDWPSSREFTHASLFSPNTETFEITDNQFHDMFCAGVATLEDGRVVAAGGNPYDVRTSAFDPASLSWRALADMNFNRWYGTALALPSDEIFATFASGAGNISERYNPATNAWTRTTGATMQDLLDE